MLPLCLSVVSFFFLVNSSHVLKGILAWEFVTRSCLKPQNPCSNHEIHMLFEHGFYLICMHDVTRERVAAMNNHFAIAFVRENIALVYMPDGLVFKQLPQDPANVYT